MATHPFGDLWRASLVLFQNEQHKEMLPTLFQKETGNQRSTATNVMQPWKHLQQAQRHAVNGFNEKDSKQLQWLPSSI